MAPSALAKFVYESGNWIATDLSTKVHQNVPNRMLNFKKNSGVKYPRPSGKERERKAKDSKEREEKREK